MLQTYTVKLYRQTDEVAAVDIEAEDWGDAWRKAYAMVDSGADLNWHVASTSGPVAFREIVGASDDD
ncbi:MAG: hypothetical protein WC822_01150 [Candidatus Paceibacterota bacterium]